MANSSFTKGTLATPVGPENGGTGLASLGTAGQTQVVNQAGTAMEWGQAGQEGVSDYTPSTRASLVCGSSPSATTVFDTLVESGGNDGAFKLSIDGTEYDNVGIDFKNLGSEAAVITQSSNNMNIDSTGLFGQSFTAPNGCYAITDIGIGWQGGGTALTIALIVRAGSTIGSGTILYQATKSVAGTGGIQSWDISQIDCEPGDTFNFTAIKNGGGTNAARYQNTNVYSGGNLYRTGSEQAGEDLQFSVNGLSHVALTTGLIATKIGEGITAVTGLRATAEYDTDHYVIYSPTYGTSGSISVLSAPSSGTDISGTGATPYLDGETGRGTVVAGTGDNGKVSLLGGEGKIDSDFVKGVSAFTAATAGYASLGRSPSATTVFDTLASGNNDGAIKLTIDGTEYDNVTLSCRAYDTPSQKAAKEGYFSDVASAMAGDNSYGQTFVAPAGMYTLSSFSIKSYTPSSGSGFNFKLKQATQPSLGTTISPTYTASWANDTNWQTFTFTEPVHIAPGTTYTIVFYWNSGTSRIGYTSGTNSTFPSRFWLNNSEWGGPLEIRINGSGLTTSTTSVLASNFQSGIRAATGGNETVTYANGHYTITSGTTGNSSHVSLLSTPTSGTDLSGNGATPYLNGETGISNYGTGTDSSVVITGTDGLIDGQLIGDTLGSYLSRDNATNYYAETDGFIIAVCIASQQYPKVYSDATATPTTAILEPENNAPANFCMPICCPIKKGNYWRTIQMKKIFWIPMGS